MASLKAFLNAAGVADKEINAATIAKKPLAHDAVLAVDRNRWFVAFVIMSIIAIGALWAAYDAHTRLESNTKLVWLKMYPSGNWDMEFHDEGRAQEFFESTIDYMITQYVERRFSKIQYSIMTDYGFASLFMSPDLRRSFQDVQQYDAARVAAEVSACHQCDQTIVKVRAKPDHYDSDNTTFDGGAEGTLYRSNVFITEMIKSADGGEKDRNNKIVSLHWRLKSAGEIKAEHRRNNNPLILKQNPIGLEILKEDVLIDPSS